MQLTRGPETGPAGTQETGCSRMAKESSCSERYDGKYGAAGSPEAPEDSEEPISRIRKPKPDLRKNLRVPKGSGGWRRRKFGRPETLQRARSSEAAGDRGEPGPVAEQKGRTGRGTGWLRCEVTGQER